ncbi:hypothetical protein AB4Z14_21225 [Terrabacter sp. 2TAF16]|uniref:hypothetical protein n=1 Tax=Terrabacter sp. 2TAF16 TaxID=3233008 RepID=UPI003F9A8846
MTFLTRSQMAELLQGLDLLPLDEEDEDGHAFTGPKHWHVFHVLARQPEAPSPARGLSTV